jgi:hypothetical protein
MQHLFLPKAQVNQTTPPPPFFGKLWNTINSEIINIMTIMMKAITKNMNLYTKNILMGLFLEFTFVLFTSNIQFP